MVYDSKLQILFDYCVPVWIIFISSLVILCIKIFSSIPIFFIHRFITFLLITHTNSLSNEELEEVFKQYSCTDYLQYCLAMVFFRKSFHKLKFLMTIYQFYWSMLYLSGLAGTCKSESQHMFCSFSISVWNILQIRNHIF